MSRTIVVCGAGPGISSAVARRFGREGFRVALVSRTAEKLEASVRALAEEGVTAKAFPYDLSEPGSVRRLVADVREKLGPVSVLHWNPYVHGAGDLTDADLGELRRTVDVSATHLVEAVQAALPDLRAEKGAVLVTGGGFAFYDSKVDAMTVEWKMMGLAIGKAAQHKAVGLLHHRLAPENVYVGEVVVLGVVKGTAFDRGQPGTLDADAIADRFWTLYADRSEASSTFSG